MSRDEAMHLKALAAVVCCIACLPGAVDAANFEIPDGEYFTLRDAIRQAEGNDEADAILLAPGGRYTPSGTLALATITTPVTIYGRGAVIDGTQADPGRVIDVASSGSLTLVDLTIDNVAYAVADPLFSGGVVDNRGSARFRNVTITGTDIDATQESVFGAVIGNSGTMSFRNVTISGNRAAGEVFGHALYNTGQASLINATVAENRFASGPSEGTVAIDTSGAESFTVANTIVADNDGDNCSGSATSNGGNVSDDTSCGLDAASDQQDTDPMLGPVADNGGRVPTQALAEGSPAIDAGQPDNGCTPMDARGMPRPEVGASGAGTACDSGAYEASDAPFGFQNAATGAWFDPDQDGHGFMLEVLPNNQVLATWFVFTSAGQRDWVQAVGPVVDGVAKMTAYQVDNGEFPPGHDPSVTSLTYWGTLSLVMHGCKSGTAAWMADRIGYANGGMPLSRLTTIAGLSCN